MASLKITGEKKLAGEVTVSGNKNAALPCLAASLLLPRAKGKTTIQNFEIVERGYERLCEKLLNLGALCRKNRKLKQSRPAFVPSSGRGELVEWTVFLILASIFLCL